MFLRMYGFERLETKMTNWGWGDAFYKKKRTSSTVTRDNSRRPNVSYSTSVSMPIVYPSNNNNDFEKYFRQKYKGEGSREYIPVMWTAYQLRFGKDRGGNLWMQQYLNGLDKSKKYFTVVQHDDGIQYDLSGLDVKVFAMSGNRIDYPLPLIADPYPYNFNEQKTVFASFIGAKTHGIRSRMNSLKDSVIRFNHDTPENYCRLMAQSVFALCPRGYGPTSFRIAEALQYGAIPVYISDRFIEPHNVPFETYGIKVTAEQVVRLDSILRSVSKERIKELQEAGKQAYKDLYSYSANYTKIIQNL